MRMLTLPLLFCVMMALTRSGSGKCVFIHELGKNTDGLIHTVVWWLALSPQSMRLPGPIPGWELPVCCLHVLPMYEWDLSG